MRRVDKAAIGPNLTGIKDRQQVECTRFINIHSGRRCSPPATQRHSPVDIIPFRARPYYDTTSFPEVRRACPALEGSEAEMQQILRRTKESRFVTGAELVSGATADTTAMRAEFLLRRKQTIGPVEFYFVQPNLTLFWLRDNFTRLKSNLD